MMQKIFLFLILLTTSNTYAQQHNQVPLVNLLAEVDKAITNANEYKEQKESKILSLKENLKTYSSYDDVNKYTTYNQLLEEYEYYKCDSAKHYALIKLSLSEKAGNESWVINSKIQMASVLFKIAMFDQATQLLDDISVEKLDISQKIEYYRAYYEIYVAWTDFMEEGYKDEQLFQKRDYYYNAFLNVLPTDSYEYACYYGIKYVNENKLSKAENLLQMWERKLQRGTRAYSILSSVLSFVYERSGDIENQKRFLALSALSDTEGCIMDNASLRALAELLYQEGKITRANTYIKKSLEDANFYNARIRDIQVSKVLRIIDNAYQLDRAKQHRHLTVLFVVISIISIILLIAVFFIIRQMRRLSKVKKKVQLMNNQLETQNHFLSESNKIKEEYVGHFMALCSTYIEKLEKYQRQLHSKATTGSTQNLLKAIQSTQIIEEVRKEFHSNFDDSFLRLFPHFVDEFNKLLPDEDKIIIKTNDKLTTELRIFALIRLGIDDSTQIAYFLNYSTSTIYNYRSRLRKKSVVNNDEFEEKVKEI